MLHGPRGEKDAEDLTSFKAYEAAWDVHTMDHDQRVALDATKVDFKFFHTVTSWGDAFRLLGVSVGVAIAEIIAIVVVVID